MGAVSDAAFCWLFGAAMLAIAIVSVLICVASDALERRRSTRAARREQVRGFEVGPPGRGR